MSSSNKRGKTTHAEHGFVLRMLDGFQVSLPEGQSTRAGDVVCYWKMLTCCLLIARTVSLGAALLYAPAISSRPARTTRSQPVAVETDAKNTDEDVSSNSSEESNTFDDRGTPENAHADRLEPISDINN